MGRNKDDKSNDKSADKSDKSKGEDETAPVAVKKDEPAAKGDDATAPIDPKLQAKATAKP
jgi:hypothetical protein